VNLEQPSEGNLLPDTVSGVTRVVSDDEDSAAALPEPGNGEGAVIASDRPEDVPEDTTNDEA
jgi:hypothetical protein